jgi:hypothetical protein
MRRLSLFLLVGIASAHHCPKIDVDKSKGSLGLALISVFVTMRGIAAEVKGKHSPTNAMFRGRMHFPPDDRIPCSNSRKHAVGVRSDPSRAWPSIVASGRLRYDGTSLLPSVRSRACRLKLHAVSGIWVAVPTSVAM